MFKLIKNGSFIAALLFTTLIIPPSLFAADLVEKAGIGIGVTAGNGVFVPAKVASVGTGLIGAALSFIFSGGDTEVARQMWRNSNQGPYLITPEVAQKAVSERPALQQK